MDRGACRLQSMGSQRVGTTERLTLTKQLHYLRRPDWVLALPDLEAFAAIDFGLGFSLLAWATKILE